MFFCNSLHIFFQFKSKIFDRFQAIAIFLVEQHISELNNKKTHKINCVLRPKSLFVDGYSLIVPENDEL